MKYLCLAYYDEDTLDGLSTDEPESIEREADSRDGRLRESGYLIAHGLLQAAQSSTCLRPNWGKVSITDGPFIEAREQIGGFFLIEARDLNEAIRVASQHPAARMGELIGSGVEIRPLRTFERF